MIQLSKRDRGRLTFLVPWSLWTASVTLSGTAVALGLVVGGSLPLHSLIWLYIGSVATATIGLLVLTRRPETRSGWLLLALATAAATAIALRQLAFFMGVHQGTSLGTAQLVIGLADASFGFVLVFWPLLFLTFPDGHLPSRRWRPVFGLLVGLAITGAVASVLQARHIVDPGAYLATTDWVTTQGLQGGEIYQAIFAALSIMFPMVLILSAASLVLRLRRAHGDERQQIKWVVFTGIITLLLFPVDTFSLPSPVLRFIQQTIGALSFVLLAGGFWVALFKYQLWDIDLVIRRSFAYAVLWLAIASLYVGVVTGLGLFAGQRFPVELAIGLTVLSTLVFQPARQWLERAADRLIFGGRDSQLKAVQGFAELLDTVECPDDIAKQLARTVAAAIGPAYIDVELDESASARYGRPNREPRTVVPITHRSEQLGKLVLQPRPGWKLTAEDESLLGALVSQAALAASRARLAVRILQAMESERRRIERNIHDGAQQELVALVAQLSLARSQAKASVDASDAHVLTRIQREVEQILSNLRELAQGIYPSVLTDGGLVEAVEDRCSRLPIQVLLDVSPPLRSRRFSDDIEGATYFFITEALTNVLKHSKSASVKVQLRLDESILTAEVVDDGIGFELGMKRGGGLAGLADRIHALGGEIAIDSRPARGTRVKATLPVPLRKAETAWA